MELGEREDRGQTSLGHRAGWSGLESRSPDPPTWASLFITLCSAPQATQSPPSLGTVSLHPEGHWNATLSQSRWALGINSRLLC